MAVKEKLSTDELNFSQGIIEEIFTGKTNKNSPNKISQKDKKNMVEESKAVAEIMGMKEMVIDEEGGELEL